MSYAVNRTADITDEEVLAYRNVPVDLAALYLGVSPMYIRCGLRDRDLPIGSAIQMSGNRWTYQISGPRLVAYHNASDMIPGEDTASEDKPSLDR